MEQARKLTVQEYFNCLELEYFSYLFRVLIYEEPRFIKMSQDICEKKKAKILEVAHQYQLPCIFKDKNEYHRVLKEEFLQPYGMPDIKYDPNRRSSAYHDKYYAFKQGRNVRYRNTVLSVKRNYPDEEQIDVMIDKKITTLRYIEVELLVEDLFF